jgi:SAM-dependent methyltransferase
METLACLLCGTKGGTSMAVPCGGDDEMLKGREFTVETCRCGFVYLNPRPTSEEIGSYYPTEYYPPAELVQRRSSDRLMKRLLRALKKGIREEFYGYPAARRSWWARACRRLLLFPEYVHLRLVGRDILPYRGTGRLLDVGCGPGRLLQELRDQGWDVHGLDFSAVAVERACSVGLDVRHGDLLTAGFKSDEFDVVLFNHSLEHVYDPAATLREALRILKPGGAVVVYLPNAGSAEAALFGRWWVVWDPPRHLYHFTKHTLARLLGQTGFRAVAIRTSVGKSSFLGSVDRVYRHVLNSSRRHGSLMRHAAGSLCLLFGHLGYGGDLRAIAEKPV